MAMCPFTDFTDSLMIKSLQHTGLLNEANLLAGDVDRTQSQSQEERPREKRRCTVEQMWNGSHRSTKLLQGSLVVGIDSQCLCRPNNLFLEGEKTVHKGPHLPRIGGREQGCVVRMPGTLRVQVRQVGSSKNDSPALAGSVGNQRGPRRSSLSPCRPKSAAPRRRTRR